MTVKYIKNGKLLKSHPYFAQVQVQLLCCEAQVAHFYVYGKTGKDQLLIVNRDHSFC